MIYCLQKLREILEKLVGFGFRLANYLNKEEIQYNSKENQSKDPSGILHNIGPQPVENENGNLEDVLQVSPKLTEERIIRCPKLRFLL